MNEFVKPRKMKMSNAKFGEIEPYIDLAYKITQAYDRFTDRIQGFLYGEYHVIRDCWMPWGEQEVYRKHISEVTDQEFYDVCAVYKMAYAIEKAMRDGK
jgi:hypothetical protein